MGERQLSLFIKRFDKDPDQVDVQGIFNRAVLIALAVLLIIIS